MYPRTKQLARASFSGCGLGPGSFSIHFNDNEKHRGLAPVCPCDDLRGHRTRTSTTLGIFLSYARGDDFEPFDPATSFVARLHRALTARGFEVWFDRVAMRVARADISPGNSGRGRRARAVGAGRRAKSRPDGLRVPGITVRVNVRNPTRDLG